MADIYLQDIVKIYGVTKEQKNKKAPLFVQLLCLLSLHWGSLFIGKNRIPIWVSDFYQ